MAQQPQPHQPHHQSPNITVSQACAIVPCCRHTVWRACLAGLIKSKKLGRRTLLDRASVERFARDGTGSLGSIRSAAARAVAAKRAAAGEGQQ